MVERHPAALDQVFGAMADETRRAIVARLALGDASVSELAEPFPMSLAAVSKHLRVLERAGLMTQRQEGRVRRCMLVPAPLRQVDDWLGDYRRFWDQRLDALVEHFKQKGR